MSDLGPGEVARRGAEVVANLVGRADELALIGELLDRAAAGGGSLVLFEEPGVGKTVLLDAAAELASTEGMEVLRAAGVEFEADLAFAHLYRIFPKLGITSRAGLRDALDALHPRSPDDS